MKTLITKIRTAIIKPENYSKQRVFIISVVLLILLFKTQIIESFNNLIVKSILTNIEKSKLNDFLFTSLSIIIILYFISRTKINYRFSLIQKSSIIFIGTLYIIALNKVDINNRPTWQFVRFTFFQAIRYADFIILIMVCMISLLIYNYVYTKGKKLTNKSYFVEDISIKSEQEDILSRKKLAIRVSDQIKSLSTESSFAIGIVGAWGTGKSSFLKLIESNISDNDTIIINFNPWLVESTEAIRKSFFDTFKERVSIYSGELSAEIGTYAKDIAEIYDNTLIKTVKESVSYFVESPTLTDQFDKINSVISSINKRIVVLIDDVDRLDKGEVAETLRLIRNTASFNNTIFLITYDKNYVNSALEKMGYANSQFFLEKIIQLEIVLPRFNRTILSKRTLEIIENSSIEEKYNEIISDFILNKTQSRSPKFTLDNYVSDTDSTYSLSYYYNFINHLRDAIRFANLFIFDFIPLAGNVKIDEIINLTLIKFKFPVIYNALKHKHILDDGLNGLAFSLEPAITVDKDRLAQHFIDNKDLYDTSQIELIDKVVNHLFGKRKVNKSERTIQRPSSFDIYFSDGTFDNLSLTEVEDLRIGTNPVDYYISKWTSSNQLEEAFDIFIDIKSFNNKIDFENIVEFIFKSGKSVDQDISQWLVELDKNKNIYATQLYNGDIIELKNLILKHLQGINDDFLYEAVIAMNLKGKLWRGTIADFILSKDELDSITLEYLSRYIQKYNKVDDTLISLYRTNATDVNKDNYVIIYKPANELMKQAILSDKLGFINNLVIPDRSPPDGIHFTFLPFIEQIFGSREEIEIFINDLPDSEEARALQSDYLLYKRNNYGPFERL